MFNARIRRALAAYSQANADAGSISDRLWRGTASREAVIALELTPERRTGKPRPGAPTAALKILDTVTFPAMLREHLELPTETNSYCWETEGWTVTGLLAFFKWLEEPDADLFDLDDEKADRYREQLESAFRAWEGDRLVESWFLGRLETATPSELLDVIQDRSQRERVLEEIGGQPTT